MKPEQPFKSWTYDDKLERWVAPKPIPNVSMPYKWNEDKKDWELLEFSAE